MSDITPEEQQFLERVRQELDRTLSDLDQSTLRDLRLARLSALESMQKPRRFWQPMGAAAIAGLITFMVVTFTFNQQPYGPLESIEDMQILSSGEELEFYEDLEFYQWMEQEEHTG